MAVVSDYLTWVRREHGIEKPVFASDEQAQADR